MKINELRIGNWYRSVKFGVPVRCDLSDLYNLCAMGYGAIDDPPISEMFEPIPIDIEWLAKFGFLKRSRRSANYYLGGWYGVFYVRRIKGQTLIKSHGYSDSVTLCDIKYVHQLQNLYFALTNEELTIKPKI